MVLLDHIRFRLQPEMAWLTKVGTLSGEQAWVIFDAPKRRQKKRGMRDNFFMGFEIMRSIHSSKFDQPLHYLDESLILTGFSAFIIRHENRLLRCIIRGVAGPYFALAEGGY